MDQKIEPQSGNSVELIDCGAASEVTRGDFIQWPWYEAGSPPFIYICRNC